MFHVINVDFSVFWWLGCDFHITCSYAILPQGLEIAL